MFSAKVTELSHFLLSVLGLAQSEHLTSFMSGLEIALIFSKLLSVPLSENY